MKNKYPIYVISKGRHDKCLTARSLNRMGGDFYIVVEPQEYELYKENYPNNKILKLPFSNLGKGSIPARNWVWENSIYNGDKKHWILDDNIEDFNRLNKNLRPRVRSMAMFAAAEDFVERYENIGLAGFNYYSFCKSTDAVPPFYLNTRIYSCILIDNSLEFRWRGRYNEDTDLSLRVLKSGLCTVLFNAFLAGKVTTMRMKGGNTDNVYTDNDDRRKFAQSLVDQHPDVAKVVWKFNRWHHQVDYKPFRKNKLIRKKGIEIPDVVNNFGMVLKSKKDKK